MIYLSPFILIFDAATIYYGAKLVAKIRDTAADDVSIKTVIFRSLQLFFLHVANLAIPISKEELTVYRLNRSLIKRILIIISLSFAALTGLIWAAIEIFTNFPSYVSNTDSGIIFLCVLLSGLATFCAWYAYDDTKQRVSHKERLHLNFARRSSGIPATTNLARSTPSEDSNEISITDAIYVSVEFSDAKRAKLALSIYRRERHGQYQYLGLPDPKTLVVHKQDLPGLLDRLEQEAFVPDRDFIIRPVFLAGQLPEEERKALRRTATDRLSKLYDPEELDRRITEANQKLAAARRH